MLMFVECGFSSQNYNGSTSFAIVNSSNKFARCFDKIIIVKREICKQTYQRNVMLQKNFLRQHYFSAPGNMSFFYISRGGGVGMFLFRTLAE